MGNTEHRPVTAQCSTQHAPQCPPTQQQQHSCICANGAETPCVRHKQSSYTHCSNSSNSCTSQVAVHWPSKHLSRHESWYGWHIHTLGWTYSTAAAQGTTADACRVAAEHCYCCCCCYWNCCCTALRWRPALRHAASVTPCHMRQNTPHAPS